MTNVEQTNAAEREPQIQPEIVVFNDTEAGVGSSGLLFEAKDGEVLEWDSRKWLDNPASRTANTTIILTESGNQYIVGKGLIINGNENYAHIVPRGQKEVVPNIIFGQSWEVPGVFKTTPVKSVLTQYKIGGVTGRFIDQESPFTAANELIQIKTRAASEKGDY